MSVKSGLEVDRCSVCCRCESDQQLHTRCKGRIENCFLSPLLNLFRQQGVQEQPYQGKYHILVERGCFIARLPFLLSSSQKAESSPLYASPSTIIGC
jgi:hypothetical protein